MRTWTRIPRSRWVDWVMVLLGAWLFVSPWVLHTVTVYASSPGDFWWVGGALFVLSLWAIGSPWVRWIEWIDVALAIWLFISPWVMAFAYARASWNAWIVAGVVFVLAIWGLSVPRATLTGRSRLRETGWPLRRRHSSHSSPTR